MLLSVLIPTYNYDCSLLVRSLSGQADRSGVEYEIIVGDDGTVRTDVLSANRAINSLPHCRYEERGINEGRSRIRNWLVSQAKGDYLLMIDSDAKVVDEHFLERYLEAVSPHTVICGGIIHPEVLPSSSVSLRYRYEKRMEPSFTAARRNLHPYDSLRTFNFLLPKEVAMSVPFNEKICGYGYEDTLLGAELQRRGVRIVHIDNPLMNTDLEENAVFLVKTEESMRTLFAMRQEMDRCSRLLRHFGRIQRLHLDSVVALQFRIFKPILHCQLMSKKPSVRLLQLYKLGYYCHLFISSGRGRR